MKPLFLPLCGWAFDLFASGKKATEYRRSGPRWNERTCVPGRAIVLSRGYGKAHRLSGVIKSFMEWPCPPDPAAWERAYGAPFDGSYLIAAIEIEVTNDPS